MLLLWKSNKCSKPLRHLFSLHFCFLNAPVSLFVKATRHQVNRKASAKTNHEIENIILIIVVVNIRVVY